VSFREDGAAALDWAARYLEGVGDFPVLAQVEPGDVRARLPATPPERGEPFADVLRDLDEIIVPGLTTGRARASLRTSPSVRRSRGSSPS